MVILQQFGISIRRNYMKNTDFNSDCSYTLLYPFIYNGLYEIHVVPSRPQLLKVIKKKAHYYVRFFCFYAFQQTFYRIISVKKFIVIQKKCLPFHLPLFIGKLGKWFYSEG